MVKPFRARVKRGRMCLHVLLCVALVALSHSANAVHITKELADVSQSMGSAADHGHDHDPAEDLDDLSWLLHGHGHDVVDHDHSPIVLLRPMERKALREQRTRWRLPTARAPSALHRRLERPPRG